MDLQLGGRRALITGSTAGIGYTIARLRKELPTANGEGVAADCATAEGAEAEFARVADVDMLANNLGIYGRMPFFDIPDAEWARYFDVNVLSGVRFARRYAWMAESSTKSCSKWGLSLFAREA
jgi:NAD(P)-dependent dehydrogenase (short-subunit alcohol dehydrogenase family)